MFKYMPTFGNFLKFSKRVFKYYFNSAVPKTGPKTQYKTTNL